MAELYKKATTTVDLLTETMYKKAGRKSIVEGSTAQSTSSTRKSERTDIAVGIRKPTFGVGFRTATKVGASRNNTREVETQAQRAEDRSRRMENRLQLAKTEINKWLDGKDNLIQKLRRQLAQQQEATRQNAEQVEELEEYVSIQETCFTTQLAGKDKLIEEINEKINQQQEDWKVEREEMKKRCVKIETIDSKKRRLDLLVAQAKLMQAEGDTNAIIIDLRRTLATAQSEASMTQDRVQAIIRRHQLNTLKLVSESLEKGWQTWSAQATELQLLRADGENRKV